MIGVAKEMLITDAKRFPIVTPLPIERLKLEEARTIPFEDAGLPRIFGFDVSQRHTLRQRQEGAASDLKEVPLLGSEAREGLKRLPLPAGSFVKDLFDVVVEGPVAGADSGRGQKFASAEFEEQH